jgi:hypothetical protein
VLVIVDKMCMRETEGGRSSGYPTLRSVVQVASKSRLEWRGIPSPHYYGLYNALKQSMHTSKSTREPKSQNRSFTPSSKTD